jgi:hypothetical protein
MASYYQNGNTIRFSVDFFDFNDEPIEPQLVRFIIYSSRYEVLEEFTLGQANSPKLGSYFFDYTPSKENKGQYYFEWYGEIDGMPTLKRDSFSLGFI